MERVDPIAVVLVGLGILVAATVHHGLGIAMIVIGFLMLVFDR